MTKKSEIVNFSPSEFKCNGISCWDKMNLDLLVKLDAARVVAGIPFFITSSWRDEETNKIVGGSSNSAHLRGNAVDIACQSSAERFLIIEALLTAGFLRIGVASTFIHADVDDDLPSPVIWTY